VTTDSKERFGDRAGAYAAHRPGYPAEAIDAVLEGLGDPRALVVADVGAGTGISSRLLAARGASVLAIEPNAKMRASAEPDVCVTWSAGTGEATGLPDRSVDVAAAFQAFHWFATAAGLGEMRRIARRRAALVQYERDEADPFTAAYGAIVARYATDDTERRRIGAMEIFARFPDARVVWAAFRSGQRLDLEGLLGRAASTSYLPQAGAPNERMREEIGATFARFANAGEVELAMMTFVITADFG
jgi:SAM-dependent methyltransferase